MLVKDLIEYADKLFTDTKRYQLHPHCKASNKPGKNILYSVDQLSAMPTRYDIIKYVVDSSLRMWLSRGDEPDRGHAEMGLNEILAAGYLFLNDQNEIIGVSNESPDFEQQDFVSLLWPVSILQVKRAPIAKQFSIVDSSSQRECQVALDERISITQNLKMPNRDAIRAANLSSRVLFSEYGRQYQPSNFFTGAPKSDLACEPINQTIIVPSA